MQEMLIEAHVQIGLSDTGNKRSGGRSGQYKETGRAYVANIYIDDEIDGSEAFDTREQLEAFAERMSKKYNVKLTLDQEPVLSY